MSGYLRRVGLRGAGLAPEREVGDVARPDGSTTPADLGPPPGTEPVGPPRPGKPGAWRRAPRLDSRRRPEPHGAEADGTARSPGPDPTSFRAGGRQPAEVSRTGGADPSAAAPEPPTPGSDGPSEARPAPLPKTPRPVATTDAEDGGTRRRFRDPDEPPVGPGAGSEATSPAAPAGPAPDTSPELAVASGDDDRGRAAPQSARPASRRDRTSPETPGRVLLPEVPPTSPESPHAPGGDPSDAPGREPREVTVRIDTVEVSTPPRRRPAPVFRAPPAARPDFGGLELTRRHLDRPPV